MEKTVTVIANVYKLFKDGKRFTKHSKKLVRSDIAIPRAYVEEKNDKWEENGLWHEIDEDATVEYYKKGAIKIAKRKADAEAKAKLKDVLTDVLVEGSKGVKKVEEPTEPEVPKSDKDLSMGELREKYPDIKAAKKTVFLKKVKESKSE